jgi:hypothetical protein
MAIIIATAMLMIDTGITSTIRAAVFAHGIEAIVIIDTILGALDTFIARAADFIEQTMVIIGALDTNTVAHQAMGFNRAGAIFVLLAPNNLCFALMAGITNLPRLAVVFVQTTDTNRRSL